MSSLPDPRDDEIVSAVLDGEATEAERERVMADPVLRARLEEFTSVQGQVSTPVTPLDEMTARRLLATAVASSPARAPAPERTIPPADPWWRRSAGWVGSAAAVIALIAGVSVLGSLDTGGDDADTAASGDDVAMSEETVIESLDADESAGGAAGEADSAPSDGDLGQSTDPPLQADSVATLVDLAVLRAEALGADSAPVSPSVTERTEAHAEPCALDPSQVFADDPPVPDPDTLVVLRGEVADRSFVVWLVLDAGEVVRTAVVDASTCDRADP